MMSCAECTAVMCACMRCAMNICPAGEMAWSSRLIRSQLGMVAQAGDPEGSVKAVLADRKDYPGAAQQMRNYLKFAGTAKGLPPDMAENHDHYLHGMPKK